MVLEVYFARLFLTAALEAKLPAGEALARLGAAPLLLAAIAAAAPEAAPEVLAFWDSVENNMGKYFSVIQEEKERKKRRKNKKKEERKKNEERKKGRMKERKEKKRKGKKQKVNHEG